MAIGDGARRKGGWSAVGRWAAIRAGALAVWAATGLWCSSGFAPAQEASVVPRLVAEEVWPRHPSFLSPERRRELREQLSQQTAGLVNQAAILKAVFELLAPSVVHIESTSGPGRAMLLGPANEVEETGSGVILDLKGRFYVLTNRHVVANATPEQVKIKLIHGRVLRPTHIWSDIESDVAVLALKETDLLAAELGNSDTVDVGDFVVALGSPFGLSYSVTLGIISAKGRRGLDLGRAGLRIQDFLQTDAAINPGNSGGPLINLQGQVIGLNTAIASKSGGNEGVGFAIPINLCRFVTEQLIEQGRVRWGYLGVTLDSQFDAAKAEQRKLPRLTGALVSAVMAGSPAALAGIQPDDVILRIGGQWIEDDSHLVNVVSQSPIVQPLSVLLWRNGRQMETSVRLVERSGR